MVNKFHILWDLLHNSGNLVSAVVKFHLAKMKSPLTNISVLFHTAVVLFWNATILDSTVLEPPKHSKIRWEAIMQVLPGRWPIPVCESIPHPHLGLNS